MTTGQVIARLEQRPGLTTEEGIMSFTRKVSLITGVAFIITFVASIPAAFYFYSPVLNNADYILGAGADTRVAWGALLEIILVVANIATAVVLYPVVKRQNEGVALGYVAARTFESVMIAVGLIAMLAVVTMRQELVGAANAASSVALGQSLVAIHDWTFLLGPGILPGIGNGLLLGYLMYRSELVPKGMAVLGMVAGTLLIASAVPIVLGVYDAGSAPQVIATAPEFVWEAFLGIYLTFKGFRAAGLRKLGFETGDSAPAVSSTSELRSVA
jgi:hypothetical protein